MSSPTIPADRNRFSMAELLPYNGLWVAFSADGSRIVASAKELAELDRLVQGAGEDPQTVGFELIQFDDTVLGGGELL